MQFLVGDIPRFAFGFANPNHAAAAVCALVPFLWGWRRFAWVGWIASAVLVVMLAMTFSRTGLAVLVAEMGVKNFTILRDFRILRDFTTLRGFRILRLGGVGRFYGILRDAVSKHYLCIVFCLLAVAGLVVWMWPRMTMDGAVMNRPKIWLAGLQLFAANPLGVGFGNSGLVASAFLLPDGVEVRTLVNSHLTMLVEGGAFIGGAWLLFVAAALLSRATMPRTRIAFAGLALSSCSASVFDWHVLFGLDVAPDFGWLNLTLSWLLFVAFVSMGVALIVRGFAWKRVGFAAGVVVVVLAGLGESESFPLLNKEFSISSNSGGRDSSAPIGGGRSGKDFASPVVAEGFVTWGDGPVVYHDSEWGLKALKEHFPQGARIRIESGVEAVEKGGPDVWLFGEVAESAEQFCDRKVTVVAPPDYYEPPSNVVDVRR